MTAPWYQRLSDGLTRTRENLQGQINVLLRRGPEVDPEFWDDLEETLIGADMGVTASSEIVARLRNDSARKALTSAEEVLAHLVDAIAEEFDVEGADPLAGDPATILVIGVNGTGKTTTVAKLAHEAVAAGRRVVLGSADTFRAAAIEQLDIWAKRADVPIVARERGADPAAVTFDTLRQAEATGADLVIIDTAGRLHTSTDLMAELSKLHRVATRESKFPVAVLLVLDATTGQNGLSQARRFAEAVGVDGVVLTKLDGTAKGGIAVAVVRELRVPIVRVGLGEGLDDLKPFDARDYALALTGTD